MGGGALGRHAGGSKPTRPEAKERTLPAGPGRSEDVICCTEVQIPCVIYFSFASGLKGFLYFVLAENQH